jgi:site-specific DNA-methyltransferase (adenine-specific)
MDAERGLPSYPDNYFDLAIVDPPYGLPSDSSNSRGKLKNRAFNSGKIVRWDLAPNELYFNELFRVSKNQIIWGSNYFPLPPTRGIIVWDKIQPWENFSQVELAWTSFNVPASLFQFDNRTGGKIHPTQKPVELYRWLLKNYAKSGMRLLDTHVGSASSLVAFEEFGFDYVAFEKDPDYYKASVARLENNRKQHSLFSGEDIFKASGGQIELF